MAYLQRNIDRFGILRSISFYNVNSELVIDENGGVAFEEYEYSSSGNVARITHKDKDGRLVRNKNGYAIENRCFDQQDRLSSTEFLSRFKLLAISSDGYFRKEQG